LVLKLFLATFVAVARPELGPSPLDVHLRLCAPERGSRRCREGL